MPIEQYLICVQHVTAASLICCVLHTSFIHTGSVSAAEMLLGCFCDATAILYLQLFQHYGMKQCIFRSYNSNKNLVKTNEWIESTETQE